MFNTVFCTLILVICLVRLGKKSLYIILLTIFGQKTLFKLTVKYLYFI